MLFVFYKYLIDIISLPSVFFMIIPFLSAIVGGLTLFDTGGSDKIGRNIKFVRAESPTSGGLRWTWM